MSQQNLEYVPDERESAIAQRQVRCVAFLLESCTELGNRELDGNIARGMAEILKLSADRLARLDDLIGLLAASQELAREARSVARKLNVA